MQTILGAGGAIGNELAKELPRYTQHIRLVSRNPHKVNEHDELFAGDLRKRDDIFSAVRGSDVVYLTAGFEYKISVWREVWPKVMRDVIEACSAYSAKLVFFDNVYAIGGDGVRHITENSPISPSSQKGEVRAELNRMIQQACEQGRIEAIIARAADFYGKIKGNSLIMETVWKNLAHNKRPMWLFNPHVKHSFTYTPDAGKATALLGNTSHAYNQIWNLPTDKNSLSGKEWIELFAQKMGKSSAFTTVPAWGVKALGVFIPFMKEFYEMRYQFDRDYFLDSSKIEQAFGITPTKYSDGVDEILADNSW